MKSQSFERGNLVDMNMFVDPVWIMVEKTMKSNDRLENAIERRGASGKLSLQKVR